MPLFVAPFLGCFRGVDQAVLPPDIPRLVKSLERRDAPTVMHDLPPRRDGE
jgi:hypothetical protein